MNKSFLALFGSGEISSTGRSVHEYIFKQLHKDPIRIALITTPAGFQPNVHIVYEEIATFFREHLTNFHPQIDIMYANTKDDANNPAIVTPISHADYIFTGPGSPTYALHHLKGTLLLDKIIEKVNAGASLALSSAATIACSKHVLPVYEIFKVGSPLHWETGLDLYSLWYKSLTIIPHYNNTEGGVKTDTSCCYMGKERMDKLLKLLPDDEEVIGLDEHTGMVIDLSSKHMEIMGKGNIHRVI